MVPGGRLSAFIRRSSSGAIPFRPGRPSPDAVAGGVLHGGDVRRGVAGGLAGAVVAG